MTSPCCETTDLAETVVVDRAAALALPPEQWRVVDGWMLRRTPGVRSRRLNALRPPADADAALAGLDAALDAARNWMPPPEQVTVQVTPADLHARTDEALAARGFASATPVDVLVGDVASMVSARARPTAAPELRVARVDPDRWRAAWGRLAGAADSDAMSGPVIARLAERVEPRTCWLTGSVSGDGGGRAVDAVVALLVTDRGARLAGVFNVVVHPDHRRRGFAAAVLVEAARAAAERGATGLYMQVTADNAPAQALYRRLGFRRLYGYHYRSARGC